MSPTQKPRTIEISTKTILMVFLLLLAATFLFFIRDIVFLVILALMFAAAIDAPIDWLDRKGVPRPMGVIFIYLLALSIFAVSIALIIPPIAQEITAVANALPGIFEQLGIYINGIPGEGTSTVESLSSVLQTIGTTFGGSSSGLFSALGNIFGGFFSIALVMVLTFYLVVRENGLKKFIRSMVPVKHRPYVTSLVNRIQYKVGLWFRGQIALGVVIFVLSYIGLTLLGVPYALVLALAAGLLEFIPYIGPIVAAIPAVIIALGDDPLTAVFVVVLYVIIQLLENNLLVPKIMQKAVGLNPVIIIIAMLIGAKVAGVIGLLLAIPIAVAIGEFTKDFLHDEVSLEPEKEKEDFDKPPARPKPKRRRRATTTRQRRTTRKTTTRRRTRRS